MSATKRKPKVTTCAKCNRRAGWGTDHVGEGNCRHHGDIPAPRAPEPEPDFPVARWWEMQPHDWTLEQRDACSGWLRANHIDPDDVPAGDLIEVQQRHVGSVLGGTIYHRRHLHPDGASGCRLMYACDEEPGDGRVLSAPVSAPLLVLPPADAFPCRMYSAPASRDHGTAEEVPA